MITASTLILRTLRECGNSQLVEAVRRVSAGVSLVTEGGKIKVKDAVGLRGLFTDIGQAQAVRDLVVLNEVIRQVDAEQAVSHANLIHG